MQEFNRNFHISILCTIISRMKETKKSVLCFGDSNTYGYNPEDGTRWPFEARWTGIAQQELGNDYRIIEEGLGGRTTVFEDPFHAGRKGIDSIPMMLETHLPLDLIVIMLGTNDCKNCFPSTSKSIAFGIQRIIDTIRAYPYQEWTACPEILVVSPIHIAKNPENGGSITFDDSSHEKSLQFSEYYRIAAKNGGADFLDAATIVGECRLDLPQCLLVFPDIEYGHYDDILRLKEIDVCP